MEALAGAGSIIGVVSLTIQLCHNVKQLREFCSRVKDASEHVKDLHDELGLLERLLERLREREERHGVDPLGTEALRQVQVEIQKILAIFIKHEPNFNSEVKTRRVWAGIKIALSKNELKELHGSLEAAKTTLIMVRQDYSEQLQYKHQEEIMSVMTQGFSRLSMQHSVRVTTNPPREISKLSEHSDDLRQSISNCLETVANPWVRAGMQAELKEEIDEHLKKITSTPVFPDTAVSSQIQGRQHVRQIFNYGSSPNERDLEIGEPQDNSSTMKMKKIRHASQQIYTSLYRTLFGSVYFSTQEASIEHLWEDADEKESATGEDRASGERQRELATKITFVPSKWLCKTFLEHGLEFSMRGGSQWKYGFRTFHSVADDAHIFEFCRNGNIEAVKTLLKRGEASPWDTDSHGWTPLHHAAWRCDVPLVRLLTEVGSELEAQTVDFPSGNYEQCSPLVLAATASSAPRVPAEQRINTMRMLLSDLDFTDQEGECWKMALVALERERRSTGTSSNTAVSRWVLDTFAGDIRNYHSYHQLTWMLLFAVEDIDVLQRVLDLCSVEFKPKGLGDGIDGGLKFGFAPLHMIITEDFRPHSLPGVQLMLERGADSHAVRNCQVGETMRSETPTTLAMRRSLYFARWRQILRNLHYDLEEFVAVELEKAPQVSPGLNGWTPATLHALFEFDFEPLEMTLWRCEQCGRDVHHLYDETETWWEWVLAEIKAGNTPSIRTAQEYHQSTEAGSVPYDSGNADAALMDDEYWNLCWKCAEMRRRLGSAYHREPIAA